MNILLIESETDRAHGLAQVLEEEGFAVQIASDSFYALTMLERHPSDLVVCGDQLEGMSVNEFAEIVREDSALAGLRVISYGEHDAEPPTDGAEPLVDLAVRGTDLSVITKEVCRFVHRTARLVDRGSGGTNARVGLVGTLAIFELQELIQLLGFSGETGRMMLEMPSAVGRMFFDEGKVVHAEYREAHGDTAVGRMLEDAIEHSESRFRFERLESAELTSVPRTIHTTVAQLLLTISVGLDTSRRASG